MDEPHVSDIQPSAIADLIRSRRTIHNFRPDAIPDAVILEARGNEVPKKTRTDFSGSASLRERIYLYTRKLSSMLSRDNLTSDPEKR